MYMPSLLIIPWSQTDLKMSMTMHVDHTVTQLNVIWILRCAVNIMILDNKMNNWLKQISHCSQKQTIFNYNTCIIM